MSTATRRDEVDEQNEVDAVPGLQRCGNRQSMPLLLVSFLLKVIRVELGLRRLYLHRQDASLHDLPCLLSLRPRRRIFSLNTLYNSNNSYTGLTKIGAQGVFEPTRWPMGL